jgi:hypothetical protein
MDEGPEIRWQGTSASEKNSMAMRSSVNGVVMTPQIVIELCNAAEHAWNAADNKVRQVQFVWRGRQYVSRLTSFNMLLVETAAGESVCCRWH